ncbi:16S rRNA (cytidine1402-2'-O)-methyltransferase [Spiroplasma chinense]|uniref:Ribosomal RNA small subunit methyltransferase I n=1 Tax=Spiroplasma chinense TaxID=216932 RepID=A0A5B9Y3J5_9MOLU|nr:16S rRNA (cytidine(1402)-2'-O)-methyltransferase [Spiroplasma chinense]QEH61581.1 16S rRNA (cytidine1402-2'-O)-methyltransferase [Spiroplasma chinense]
MFKIQKTFKDNLPIIYVVGTPIGNMADFSNRAVECLNDAEIIYCEDTRTSNVLLKKYNISKPLRSLHKFNENEKIDELESVLKQNRNIALISDAGVPLISDPGARILNELSNKEVQFSICPVNCGPAYIHAMVMSGFEAKENIFLGFLDKKPNQLKEKLSLYKKSDDLIVTFYESVHRIVNTLNVLGSFIDKKHNIAIVREITKLNEEVIKGTIQEVKEFVNSPDFVEKGEFVVVLDKNYNLEEKEAEFDAIEEIEELISQGTSKKEAIKVVAKNRGLNKAELYKKFHKF